MLSPEIHQLQPTDLDLFIDLIRVFEEIFEMDNFFLPPKVHLQKLLENPDFFVFIAKSDRSVLGGLTGYILHQYYSVKPLAYIYDLAVLGKYQRQGFGGRLISATRDYCRQKGFEEVFVQADQVDTFALDFYRKTGPTEEEEVRHFYYKIG